MMKHEELLANLQTLRERLVGWTIVDFLETSQPEGVFGMVVENCGMRKVQEVYATELGWWLFDLHPYRETLYIDVGEKVYVPRPSSVFAGQARDIWVSKCLGVECRIASPEYWNELAHKFPVSRLFGTDKVWKTECLKKP